MSKSYVGMAAQFCPACGRKHHESILLDKRLKESFENGTTYAEGWVLCDEHQKMIDDGFLILVAIDTEKSPTKPNGNIDPKDAYRLGPIAGVKAEAAKRIFNVELQKITFVDQEIIDMLEQMQPKD